MADTPWLGDTCSLAEAFRGGERSPLEELDATLAAIEASDRNAFSFLDVEGARARAEAADTSRPFGGVPVGVKELDNVEGWPSTEASLVFKDRRATYTGTMIQRLADDGGANLVGLTTASEFGGLNISTTKLNGVTGNAWDPSRTAGGSSSGSAAAVAAGQVTIATGGDGGGSIRIPAAFNGLVGMKGTAGRIPRGPNAMIALLTVVIGCLARSVRDVCRWYDVTAGHDSRDPYSLPRVEGWERDLGTHGDSLRGKRLAVLPDLMGSAVVRPAVADTIAEAGEQLAKATGMHLVEIEPVTIPEMGLEWAMGNLAGLAAELGDRWPGCRDDLTMEISFGIQMAKEHFTLDMAGAAEIKRMRCNEAIAAVFDQADVIVCATNPDVAFPAEVSVNTRVGDVKVGIENNLALTGPFNLVGNPSCSVPVGTLPFVADDGSPSETELPVGMQIVGPHHTDQLLLDLAATLERERPWSIVAPGAPH